MMPAAMVNIMENAPIIQSVVNKATGTSCMKLLNSHTVATFKSEHGSLNFNATPSKTVKMTILIKLVMEMAKIVALSWFFKPVLSLLFSPHIPANDTACVE